MGKIKLDEAAIKFISLVESITGAKVKDCINTTERIIFIINETDIGRAIGKKGSNIRRIEGLIKKKVKMVEFSPDEAQFIKNYIYPLEVNEVRKEGDDIIIAGRDTKTRGLIIGRDRANVNMLKDIVNRYFKIHEIKVV